MRSILLVVLLCLLAPVVAHTATLGCDAVACKTSAGDTVPRLDLPATLTSVQDGAWTDPATWGGRVPEASDKVSIPKGRTITYDAMPGFASTIGLEGMLTFSATQNTSLTVGTLLALPGGYIDISTTDPTITTVIEVADVPIDTTRDPGAYGTGVLALDATVRLLGAQKTPFARLALESRAGDTIVQVATPVQGWLAGDIVHFGDSSPWHPNTNQSYVNRSEDVTLAAVDATGTRLTLATPLRFAHPGARNADGVLELLPHVANISRNVVIRSQNPQGTRGHVWLSQRSDVDIQYVTFLNLGRTTIAPLDNTTFDAQGHVTHLGTNQIGRYPLHAHHLYALTPPMHPYQFQLIGNVVYDQDPKTKFKWSVAVHDSSYGRVQDTVVVNAAGFGIGTEDGSEREVLFEHNLVSHTRGTGARDTSEGGSCYWGRGPLVRWRNNVAANCLGIETSSDPGGYGFALFFQYLPTPLKIPTAPGNDTTIPGQFTTVDGNATPLAEFVGNECYGPTNTCLTVWWHCAASNVARPCPTPGILQSFTAWHFTRYGIWFYPQGDMETRDLVIRGYAGWLNNPNITSVGILYGDYMARNPVVHHADIQNVRYGIWSPANPNGPLVVQNSTLRNAIDVLVQTPGAPGASPDGRTMHPLTVLLDHNRHGLPAGMAPASKLDVKMEYTTQSGSANLTIPVQVQVTGYNQVATEDYSVHFLESRADFILPLSGPVPYIGGPYLVGCPEANLTNEACFAKYGKTLAGLLAPCMDTTSHPRIQGITCPLNPTPILAPPPPMNLTVTIP